MPSAQLDGNADGSLEEHSRLIRIVRSNNPAKTNAISSELFYKPLNGRILLSSHAWFSMVDWSLSWNTKITDSLPGTHAPQGKPSANYNRISILHVTQSPQRQPGAK